MKITGGAFKGRSIKQKVRDGVRPTASKVREALFNIIGAEITDSRFLDLYAGTGVVGFEALARGSKVVFFVDKDIEAIEKLIKLHKYINCKTIQGDVKKVLITLVKWGERFDLIYVDPPYESDEIDSVLPILSQILAKDGLIVIEHFHKKTMPINYEQLYKLKDYRYGDSMLSLYKGDANEY